MAWKVGQELVAVCVEEPSGKITWDTWRIRTIRKTVVYATLVTDWTWGKVSKKHGDYGWLDPIPSYCRTSWTITEGPSRWRGLATTKIKALEAAIQSQKSSGHDDDYEGITNAEIIKKLETMLLKTRNKRKK